MEEMNEKLGMGWLPDLPDSESRLTGVMYSPGWSRTDRIL